MNAPLYPLFALSRHRLGSDGAGVTTLAAARGCPLRCKYCLNPQALREETPVRLVAPAQLYAMTRVDGLYFQATGGGVTFGGGEPLLYAPFIAAFREQCGPAWRLRAETSLNVPEELARTALSALDEVIVDIKDASPAIYRAYTGGDNARALSNLRLALAMLGAERVLARAEHSWFQYGRGCGKYHRRPARHGRQAAQCIHISPAGRWQSVRACAIIPPGASGEGRAYGNGYIFKKGAEP